MDSNRGGFSGRGRGNFLNPSPFQAFGTRAPNAGGRGHSVSDTSAAFGSGPAAFPSYSRGRGRSDFQQSESAFRNLFNNNGGAENLGMDSVKNEISAVDVKNEEANAESEKPQCWADVRALMERVEVEKWKSCPPIKKDFYVEKPEITQMTDEEVNAFRASINNVTVEDVNQNRAPIKPVKTFAQAFDAYPEILQQLEHNFKEPTPIQAQVWPLALSGYDVIGIAQTGTGKTLSFLLPIFIHLENQPLSRKDRKGGPACIILSPTRELALQIDSEVKKFYYRGITSVCIYGGGSRNEQIEVCNNGVDIVIATPGRLNDLVRVDVINLKTVTFLVLDEADRMLDLGFEAQIMKVLLDVRPDRHTMMTSATWPNEVRRLAARYMKDPFLVYVGTLDLTAVHSVTQEIHILDAEEKMDHLMNFLKNMDKDDKVIVFVGKKDLVDHLASEFVQYGISCQSMHGKRDQGDRERALSDIKSGRSRILIATDLASRGIDIKDITHVYNYDFPRNIEEYVHRVGRTGRAGRTGVSITLFTRYDWRHATDLINILEEANQPVPPPLRHMSQRYEAKKSTFQQRPMRREVRDEFNNFQLCP